MDQNGIRVLLEKKQGRPCTDAENAIISKLTVRDCIRVWDDIAFGDGEVNLEKFLEPEEEVDVDDLPPQRRKILTDIKKLRDALGRLGKVDDKDGYVKTTFREAKDDMKLKAQLDSIPGTCRLARKEGLVFFESRDLVTGRDDDVKIFLIQVENDPTAGLGTRSRAASGVAPPTTGAAAGAGASAGTAGGGAAAAPMGERPRTGSVLKPKPIPVSDEEVTKLTETMGRTCTIVGGKNKVKFGVLRADANMSQFTPPRLTEVCLEAKNRGVIKFMTETLIPNKDDNVYVELL